MKHDTDMAGRPNQRKKGLDVTCHAHLAVHDIERSFQNKEKEFAINRG